MKMTIWQRVKAVKYQIAGLVKAFFEFLWDNIGWRLFAVVFCGLGIVVIVFWLMMR